MPGSSETFTFVDETHRRDLKAALQMTVAGSAQRACVPVVPVEAESATAAQARRQAAELMRAEKARSGEAKFQKAESRGKSGKSGSANFGGPYLSRAVVTRAEK